MTQLFIDNQEVILGSDFSIDLKVANPIITKEGDSTYDISINLRNRQNAQVYQLLTRLNRTNTYKDRSAQLMIDGHVLLTGTEVILGNDGNTVDIQILAKNSEFNHALSDMKMGDLDLGEIPVSSGNDYVTKAEALETLEGYYPDHNHVFVPILRNYNFAPMIFPDSVVASVWFKTALIKNELYFGPGELNYESTATLIPQPYLLYYVEKVLRALGYTIKRNTLTEDTNLKNSQLYILNSKKTLKYNEMVPNWDVEKFIDEIEKFFMITIQVDENKNVSIINATDHYRTAERYYIDDEEVIDDYERKYGEDNSLPVTYDNVSYNFPDTTLYKYWVLSNDLIEACNVDNTGITWTAWWEDWMKQNDLAQTIYNRLYLFTVTDRPGYHLIRRDLKRGTSDRWQYMPWMADIMHPVENENSNNSTEMNIVPAEVIAMTYDWDANGNIGFIPIAFCRDPNSRTTPTEDTDYSDLDDGEKAGGGTTKEEGLNEYVMGKLPEEAVQEQLFISYYCGLQPTWFDPDSPMSVADQIRTLYPMSAVYPWVSCHRARNTGSLAAAYEKNLRLCRYSGYDLSPQFRHEHLYNNAIKIDGDTEYILRFKCDTVLDPKRIFVIRGLAFYCKELKYTIDAKGLNKICEGTFFPIQSI